MRANVSPAVVITLVLLAATGCVSLAEDNCAYTATREVDAPGDGVKGVRIHALAGTLTVEGDPDMTTIEAHGIACAARQEVLSDVDLDLDVRGEWIHIDVTLPDADSWREQSSLDLTVRVPARLAMVIEDTSGSLTVRGVHSLELEDSSGSIAVSAIATDVTIDDDSGSLEVEGVGGNLTIADDSGSISVSRVGGHVTIEDDSGSIEVRTVGGNVIIEDDDSGSISVFNVDGDFIVKQDDSGSIEAVGVRGDFIVEHNGSGSITHRDIGGRVSVPGDDR